MKFKKMTLILVIITISIIIVVGIYFLSNQPFDDVKVSPNEARYVILGTSSIEVPHNAIVVVQVDRVIKDITLGLNNDVPPYRRPSSPNEVLDYMEGSRVRELMQYADVQVIPATNVPCKNINGTWYGPDDKGNFVFSIQPIQVNYNISAKRVQISPDTVVQVDTHGMNVLVPEAIKDHAFLVVGCGDWPGKADAEAYMAERGINCYAPCDRFTSNILDYKGPGVILGSEPIRPVKDKKEAVIGAQPIAIDLKDKIIVQNTYNGYPDQYCDTPNRYFTSLRDKYQLDLDLDVVYANIGETNKLVDEAHKTGTNVIAVRVFNGKDETPVKNWLKESKKHKAILFHSAAYDGYNLFFEFPDQVTGQDPKPIFIKDIQPNELQKRIDQIRSIWM
jgi:hypothetical protein